MVNFAGTRGVGGQLKTAQPNKPHCPGLMGQLCIPVPEHISESTAFSHLSSAYLLCCLNLPEIPSRVHFAGKLKVICRPHRHMPVVMQEFSKAECDIFSSRYLENSSLGSLHPRTSSKGGEKLYNENFPNEVSAPRSISGCLPTEEPQKDTVAQGKSSYSCLCWKD